MSLEELVIKMLRKYDTVEIKRIHGQLQVIGINRKLECKINIE